jgi:small subunit ribosomal protein S17
MDETTQTAAAPGAAPAAEADTRHRRKVRRGVVVSKSGAKSIVVRCERRRPHPKYGKVLREFRRCHAHDEADAARVGDTVEIVECRPLSRLKRWRLVAVTQKAAEGAQPA